MIASPARTQSAFIGHRESDRTASKRIRTSSVVSADSPMRRSNGSFLGTRSGCVGPEHAAASRSRMIVIRLKADTTGDITLAKQIEHVRVLDDQRSIGALGPLEQ